MGIRSGITTDKRYNSRTVVRLDAKITYERSEHAAVIVDLSQRGALISSEFLPSASHTYTAQDCSNFF